MGQVHVTEETESGSPSKSRAERPHLWKSQHVIALGIGLLGLVVGAWGLYQASKSDHAELEVRLLSKATIADLQETQGSGRLRLLYEDKELQSASLISVEVRNVGERDIVQIVESDVSDHRNPRVQVDVSPGSILETHTRNEGDDQSTRFSQIVGNGGKSVDFVISLMNADAIAQIDLVVAGILAGETPNVQVLGQGVNGRVVSSPQEPSSFWKWPIGLLVVVAFCFYAGLVIHCMAWFGNRDGIVWNTLTLLALVLGFIVPTGVGAFLFVQLMFSG